MRQAYVILESGEVFPGEAFGAPADTVGELVFTTAPTGYLETLTDPSYYGQIVVQAFPLMGNVGVIPQDFESEGPHLSGYIVGEWCHAPSNFRGEGTLDAFLLSRGIPGVSGVDTRALVKRIRERGVMNAVLSASPDPQQAARAAAWRLEGAVERAGGKERAVYGPENGRPVVLWDFGAKRGIPRQLADRGCRVLSVPHDTTAQEILALHPQGVLLSNGPGDPADNPAVIGQVRQLCGRVPLFGICLGHQLLALARGATTAKLHYGHRGANQPVRDTQTGRVYITSQNHGYAVDTPPPGGRVRFTNANDGTCEGLDYDDIPAFSAQFHPEGCGGPQDTQFLFERFLACLQQPAG